ncbi:MAG: rhodanese-like domain-containing protein [Planctomycetes bacterium]|nr:rhodanese-like domain-containing protein [Planctomycetota bacterium]
MHSVRTVHISMEMALRRVQGGEAVTLVDVRSSEEYARGSLPGSLSVPFTGDASFLDRLEREIPDKNATLFVFCRSGRRSREAVALLRAAGYHNAVSIGGIVDLPPAVRDSLLGVAT